MVAKHEAEKRAWVATAAENEVELRGMDLSQCKEMEELFQLLRVEGIAAKSRLRAFIRDL